MGWIGVDFDCTLAEYDGWNNGELGKPVPLMLERVKRWLKEGREVRIFTARVGCSGLMSGVGFDGVDFAQEQREAIQAWCVEHLGVALEVTATKDFNMEALWDDRAVGVEPNTGKVRTDDKVKEHRDFKEEVQ